MIVRRTPRYRASLDAIETYVAQDSPQAAMALWLHIDEQVDKLAEPNFPRRLGRVAGTLELVAHENYVVILEQLGNTVTALDVLHVARQFP
jgi:plasmid stabilization system protein ParE